MTSPTVTCASCARAAASRSVDTSRSPTLRHASDGERRQSAACAARRRGRRGCRGAAEAGLDELEAVLVHVEVAAQLDLDGVDAVGRAAVVGGDEAALVGIVRGDAQAGGLEVARHVRRQRRRAAGAVAIAGDDVGAGASRILVAGAAARRHRMAVEQDGEAEAFARPRRARASIASWYAAWMAVRSRHSSSASGRDSVGTPVVVIAQMKPRPSALRGAGCSGTAPGADVVGIAVQVADEARGLRRDVDLGRRRARRCGTGDRRTGRRRSGRPARGSASRSNPAVRRPACGTLTTSGDVGSVAVRVASAPSIMSNIIRPPRTSSCSRCRRSGRRCCR